MDKKADDLIAIDGKKEASEILASLDPTHRERILVEIAQRDPELAEILRKGLFRFDQVLGLEILELQKVIRAQDSRLLALSLRGMKPEEKQILYSKIPERQARAIEEEIQSMGPQKSSDVIAAREKIVDFARQLHEKGEIHLK
jgi:flagellar motor switch protein FliG